MYRLFIVVLCVHVCVLELKQRTVLLFFPWFSPLTKRLLKLVLKLFLTSFVLDSTAWKTVCFTCVCKPLIILLCNSVSPEDRWICLLFPCYVFLAVTFLTFPEVLLMVLALSLRLNFESTYLHHIALNVYLNITGTFTILVSFLNFVKLAQGQMH